jgi:hypothetical protein
MRRGFQAVFPGGWNPSVTHRGTTRAKRYRSNSISNTMETSIIVVNYNTCALLRNCLSSVRAQTRNVTCEIFVVDYTYATLCYKTGLLDLTAFLRI